MNEHHVKEANSYMRYQDIPGERTAILFIHGLGCAGSFDYSQVVTQRELSGHRMILLDLLGAGYSDKPFDFEYSVAAHARYLKAFIEELALSEFILFGHSLGGSVAIELADICADKVECLILSEANLDPSVEGAASYKIAHLDERYFAEKGFQEMIQGCKLVGNAMWASCLANWLPIAVHRFSKSGVQGGSLSWRTMLYDLPMRKNYIFGEKSLPNKDFEELEKYGINVETVPNAGHFMAWENPQGLAFAIEHCFKV